MEIGLADQDKNIHRQILCHESFKNLLNCLFRVILDRFSYHFNRFGIENWICP